MPRHVLVDDSDSDSDEPIALDSPPVSLRRTRSASSQPLSGRAGPSRSSKRRVKKQKTPDEDDEVVFVREEKVRQLTSRFAFAGARPLRKTTSTASSASVPTASLGSTSSASTTIATPFLSSTPRQPLPVPEWLPKTAILKELPKCVLCQRDFKKAESGAARWRHVSTCLPPAFRPPNLPPDLEVLISTALEGPVQELTLLRRRTNAAAAADDLLSSFPDLVPKPKRVLRNTTVRASYSREGWSDEVDLRVVEVVGVSPMRQSRYLSRSVTPDPEATQLSPAHSLSSSPLLSTQPLGESSLSTEYSRPPRTRSAMSNLLPQAPPLIGLSQAMRYSFAEEEATQTQRAHIALSQYTSEVGLEAGDGFHFSSQRPCEASSSPPQTPPARRTFQGGGYSQPFRHGVGPQPAGSRPRHTAGGLDPERRRRLAEAVEAGVEEARQRRREAIAAAIGQR
ncbi:uncharacterized protein CcaverHIS019_0303490 [Cutaneotrichosporon cavernicola]|uniref:Uncharacterized protein n=1 Tax=Cutaneotrichosporon cavernicola TaxID=279322 RepID=A0AA48I2Z6_9TREE|nr:uncharacterized protein CcaverHIS019_0303490 [Cutaneotrichosporon cavernicola]BEI90279.1 hypothetical protein CcaverHIS019_0303490 [Cutaneotrichosporon cavernicola]BEI98055.1 hypothetical protein CcaverHIS631_0303540 [Cutaneotrichosporon cavernicola]